MPKSKANTSNSQLVPTESPVPGVSIELATLLVQGVKARRKANKASTSDASADNEEDEAKVRELQNTADDKTVLFLNALQRQVENSSAAAAPSSTSSSSRERTTKKKHDAPTNCIIFLLETLSDTSNSYILRRAALTITREILERSSNARAYLAEGQCLLDFVSMVEGISTDNQHGQETSEGGGHNSNATMATASIFQLEAIELVHHLASKFGRFYTRFVVASRLVGDISAANLSMHTATTQSQRANMGILRKERDNALEHGVKACHNFQRMIERADGYFRVLVPRMGGFNNMTTTRSTSQTTNEGTAETKSKSLENHVVESTESAVSNQARKGGEDDDELNGDSDDDSIDWEEGEMDFDGESTTNELQVENDKKEFSVIDHQSAVEQTLDIMSRGGALLDGKLAVPVGGGAVPESTAVKDTSTGQNTSTNIDPRPGNEDAVLSETRKKLHNLVQKFTKRLPRLNRWLHALSYADGMVERAVMDPATAVNTNTAQAPVSLILLSEEKRALRSEILRLMLKLRNEVEGVLKSSGTLGIQPQNGDDRKNVTTGEEHLLGQVHQQSTAESVETRADVQGNDSSEVKRPWPPGETDASFSANGKKKKAKTSRFKVIYRKK